MWEIDFAKYLESILNFIGKLLRNHSLEKFAASKQLQAILFSEKKVLTEEQLKFIGISVDFSAHPQSEETEHAIGTAQAVFEHLKKIAPFKKFVESTSLGPKELEEMPPEVRLGYNLCIENYSDEINHMSTFKKFQYLNRDSIEHLNKIRQNQELKSTSEKKP